MLGQPVFAIVAFVLGAVVGSFLNACIYRMPRNIKLGEPKRSFCTSCERMIPWYHNIPLVSWPLLRGRCANCGARFSIRYWGIEWLTAFLFLAMWMQAGLLAPAYWFFVALLIVATFIDFDFYIIPDEITVGGTVAGLVLSGLFPQMMGETVWWRGLLWSAVGAASGFFVLWGVVELGKLAFGKKRLALDRPQPFAVEEVGEEEDAQIFFVLGEERTAWEEFFSRATDVLHVECDHVEVSVADPADGQTKVRHISGRAGEPVKVGIYYNRIVMGGEEVSLENVERIRGMARSVVIPREAMGFGDVKFIACIGAFLGWQAVAFTILASSVIGALVGGGAILLTRGQEGSRIPFGPYLALGAILWMFIGPQAVDWYFGLLRPAYN